MSTQPGSKAKRHLYAEELRRGDSFLHRTDLLRLDASRKIEESTRARLGQFFTHPDVSRLMASMFSERAEEVRLLDAGAGTGALSAAFVNELSQWKKRPGKLSVTAYELDPELTSYLLATLEACERRALELGLSFSSQTFAEDFIQTGVDILQGRLVSPRETKFNYAILNPPYRKINSQSVPRRHLSSIGLETSNLYTGFLEIVSRLLEPGGELCAITPRSFCNGPYFKAFRKSFLRVMTIRRIHVFESRDRAFEDDAVLQENIIFHAVKTADKSGAKVIITSSSGPEDTLLTSRVVDYDQLVSPDDDQFIHIVPDETERRIREQMSAFTATLPGLGLRVSTGRVVDFRASGYLRQEPEEGSAPLIYPGHLSEGGVKWPKKGSKKPNAILSRPETSDLLVPAGIYVLVRRFSAKEERRRIVAAVYDPRQVTGRAVGFENHLNYYHCDGKGIGRDLAQGLSAFLNSTLVDSYFRHFNGHTQVNATDLRNLRYPSRAELVALGGRINGVLPEQKTLDQLVREELTGMTDEGAADPVRVKEKIRDAIRILKDLGLPAAQQNSRSALTLLSLIDLGPEMSWSESTNPLRGITAMMKFFDERYGVKYEPNTRETVRDETVKPFVNAGIAIPNPDKPRAPNSPRYCYQIAPDVLALLQTFDTAEWDEKVRQYLRGASTLREKYANERRMRLIPVTTEDGQEFQLTPEGQNVLIKAIIEEFCPRFTPGGKVLYVGDAGAKWDKTKREAFEKLGVKFESAAIPMPDVVVHYTKKDWLVLIEAVTSGGEISLARKEELTRIFGRSRAGLVFVTTFLTRKEMVRFLGKISWETEVWIAESPSHMIHFNGERFLGPYNASSPL